MVILARIAYRVQNMIILPAVADKITRQYMTVAKNKWDLR